MSAISYKCPNCGGELIFNPNTQRYKCEYCFSDFSQEELDAANPDAVEEEKETVEKAAEKAAEGKSQADGEDFDAVAYTCPSCGAEIVTDGTTAATFCYYCHNPVVLKGRVTGEYRPDLVIPFRIDKKKAQQEFLDYVHKKKFIPKAFFSKDQIEKLSGVYFPAWLFDAEMEGNLTATGSKIRVWVSGDTEYTETKEYAVERGGTIRMDELNKNALKKANQKLVEGVWPYNLEEAKAFSMGYLSGFLAEKRDIEAGELEDQVKKEFSEYGEKILMESAEGYDSLVPRSNQCIVRKLTGKYALLPVWTVTYKGRDGKMYYYTMNGQSGNVVGELPIDNKKVALLFFGVMLPVLILGLIGGFFL